MNTRGTSAAVAPPLVGRDAMLTELRDFVGHAAVGDSGAVILTGLPGVGKTALARAALDLAARAGFATFAGHARPLSHDVAYAPLAEAFGPMLRALGAHDRERTLRDLDPLALVFTGLGLAAPAPLGDPALERSRLADAFTRLAERLADGRPLALLVDDVNAVDDASAAVLGHLVAGAVAGPTLLLLTTRAEATDRARADEVASALAESAWWVERRTVAPLDDTDAAHLVRGVLGPDAGGDVVERIVARCGGRPLFLDATARTVAEHGVRDIAGSADLPVPEDVVSLLRGRLTGCTPPERAVLDLLAVAGDALDFDSIVRAGGLDGDAVVAALDGLERRGIVQTVAGRGFDLAHALLREVAAAELSGVITQRTHARLVAALEVTRPDDPRAAEHALGAGPLLDPARALAQLTRGGARARELGMNEAAVRYLSAAVELAETQTDAAQRSDLLASLADSHRRLGRPEQARGTWQRALDGYARAGRMDGVARIEQDLGLLDWATGALGEAHEHFDRAEAALDGLEPSPAHADLLYTRTITASRIGDAETVGRSARALRRLAGELGSAALEAQAYLAEAVLDYAEADYLRMTDNNRRALAAAERSGDPLLVIRAHDQLSVAAASQLDLPALRAHSEASLRLAIELGATTLQGWPRGRLATTDLLSGDWDAALRSTTELIGFPARHGERRGAISTAAGHAWVLVHRGRLDEARRQLARARADASPMLESDRNIFSIVAIAEGWLALAEDEPARAVERCAQLENTTGGWLPQFGLALLGEARARSGDVTGAEQITERLQAIRSCATPAPQALAGWVAGLAALAAGRPAPAVERLLASAAAFETLGLPFHAARMRLAAASADASAHPKAAADRARAALDVFDRLGAPIEAQRSRELLRGLGVVPSRGRARRSTGTTLSVRELEVARAVASGLSNAEVAAALFISPRTVTTHLDRIYARLGLGSRAALTRYLADEGLLTGGDPPGPVNT